MGLKVKVPASKPDDLSSILWIHMVKAENHLPGVLWPPGVNSDTYAYTDMHTHTHTHMHIHVHTQTCTLMHTHVHTHTHVHSRTHTYMSINVLKERMTMAGQLSSEFLVTSSSRSLLSLQIHLCSYKIKTTEGDSEVVFFL